MNTHKMNMESIIDFVTNGDISDLSELSSDEESEDEIQMVANVQEEYEGEFSEDEVKMKSVFLYPKFLIHHHFLPLKLPNHNWKLTSHQLTPLLHHETNQQRSTLIIGEKNIDQLREHNFMESLVTHL